MFKDFTFVGFLFLLIGLFSSVSSAQTVLSAGSQSQVDQPFVFIARDAKTYAQLQNLVEGLPAVSTVDFRRNAVVAGFAGTRPTGGWTVEIKKSGNRFGVVIQPPAKGSMVIQVITTPFKVSLVPVDEEAGLLLTLAPAIINQMQVFRVNKGDFEFTGGIAGICRKFKADGTIRLLTFGEYSTIWFDLKGKGTEKKRKLSDIASGTLKIGKFELPRLDAGSFVELPRPPFEVIGTLKSKVLSLNFNSLPTNLADGFEGKGKLEAIRLK
jgi:hypothetical protein